MNERGKRRWLLRAGDFEDDSAFRAAVADELAGLENIGHRLGGGFVSSPVRQAIEDGSGLTEYVTVAWLFEHTFMPAVRARETEAPEPITDEELERDALEHAREREPVEA